MKALKWWTLIVLGAAIVGWTWAKPGTSWIEMIASMTGGACVGCGMAMLTIERIMGRGR